MKPQALITFCLALTILALTGCSSSRPEATPMVAIPAAEPTPRVVTDLSSLSGKDLATAASQAEAPAGAAPSATSTPGAGYVENLNRLFLETPASNQFVGTAAAPGSERLANAKASKFPQFSRTLLHQVFVVAQQLQRDRSISRERLPADIGSVVITATMSAQGKLSELIVEKSSGSGLVDQLMVQACRKGLWSVNPPPAALSADGNYRMQIETSMKNYNRPTPERIWNFETQMSIALD